MLHVELRQGRHQTRAFNLEEAEVARRFLAPVLAQRTFLHDDREWEPRKLRLTVVDAPRLGVEQMGMGRGWANVQKVGRDVTAEVLQRARDGGRDAPSVNAVPPELDRLGERLLGRLAAGPVPLAEVVALADDVVPGRRVSERLAIAELAVWRLLHREEAVLLDPARDEPVASEAWQGRLLAWESWAQATTSSIILARSASEAKR